MARERNETGNSSGKRSFRWIEAAIAAIAEAQYGLITRDQLFGLGLDDDAIGYRLAIGRLHRIHRGVYAVGHRRLPRHGYWLAAVLAAGEGAVLSHGSAAELWKLRTTKAPEIDVTVTVKRRAHAGVRIHLTQLDDNEITRRGPIPVTTPLRILLDLSSQLTVPQLEQAIGQAEYRKLASTASLASRLSSHHGRRGAKTLRRALLLANTGNGRTRSDLETAFLAFLRRHRLPPPDLNATIDLRGYTIEADCYWPGHRLIAELDGGAAHTTTHAFFANRARDRRAQAAGLTAIRVTWPDLEDATRGLAADLASFLA
jgi:very-short-patch-repair endonuclease